MKDFRERRHVDLVRRRLVGAIVTAPAMTLVGCSSGNDTASQPIAAAPTSLTPTPACDDGDDEPTPSQTEGPYFTSSSPERASLVESGMAGTRLAIAGRVLSISCQPIARAKLDFWQADQAGVYDNSGYRLRGHQYTNDNGEFRLETIVPGLYPGRTRHIHVKAQAPNGRVLTTQLYFPGEARNASDGIFDSRLLMAVQDASGSISATFTFVLPS